MPNTLLLVFEAAFQSWGERGQWTMRDTAATPTKSGVTGLLGCALGYTRDADLLALTEAITIGVRVDRAGTIWTDFETVTTGALTAAGKIKRSATTGEIETQLVLRTYLADARFLVAIRADAARIDRLAEAVQDPYWPVYLGRRKCVPARPVYEAVGDYPNLTAAVQSQPFDGSRWATWPADRRPREVTLPIEIEVALATGRRRYDVCLSNARRQFGSRYVRDGQVTVPVHLRDQMPAGGQGDVLITSGA